MSGFDLHEFNALSKRHNYFMTNNRMTGFPFLQENSLLLKKILLNKKSNSNDKRFDNSNNVKAKKFVRFAKPEFKDIYQSPLIFKKKLNNSNDNLKNRRYHNNFNNIIINSNKKEAISPYNKNRAIELGKSSIQNNYYIIPINNGTPILNSPNIYRKHMKIGTISSNINDSDNEKVVLNFKGKRIFASNLFSGLNNDSLSNSPEKNDNNSNNGSIKGAELFRSSEELKKKKEEIFLRKMKRESSSIMREKLKTEKDKDIKNEKLNIDINSINNSDNKNQMRIIPLNKEINNIKKVNNRFISSKNKIKNNNSFKINNLNKDSPNTPTHYSNNIKRIYKFQNNKDSIDMQNDSNIISKKSHDSNSPKNTVKIPYAEKSFKTNNIFLSKYSSTTPPKNVNRININNRIKENLEFLRLSKKSGDDSNKKDLYYTTEKSISPDRHNNPYQFITTKKKFVEDNRQKESIIYSKDKKISIKIHTLQNLNETFVAKRPTRKKLKMQRVISIAFQINNKIQSYHFRPGISKKKKENITLKSIKEEEEKSKYESSQNLIKEEKSKIESIKKIFEEKKPNNELKIKLIKEEKSKFEPRFKKEEKSKIEDGNKLNKENESKEKNTRHRYHRYKLNKEENSKIETSQNQNKEEKPKFEMKKLKKEEKPKIEPKQNLNKEEKPKYKSRYRATMREEKAKDEPNETKNKIIKTESKKEIDNKKENPPLENNVKRRYWRRFEHKK